MILFNSFTNQFLGGVAVAQDIIAGGEIVASKVSSPLDAWELESRAEAARFIRKMQTVTPYKGDALANEIMDESLWLALEFA